MDANSRKHTTHGRKIERDEAPKAKEKFSTPLQPYWLTEIFHCKSFRVTKGNTNEEGSCFQIKKGVVFFRILFVESTFNLLLKSWCTQTGNFGFTLLFTCDIDL